MQIKINWRFILQFTLPFCLFFYLIFLGGRGYNIARSGEIYLINLAVFLGLAVVLLLFILRSKDIFFNRYLCLSILMFFLAAGVAVIFSSRLSVSIREYYYWGAYLILFLSLVFVRQLGWRQEYLLQAWLIVGGILIFGKLLHTFQWTWVWLRNNPLSLSFIRGYRPTAPNLSGAIANLIIFISAGLICDRRGKGSSIPLIGLIAGGFLVLWGSSSRGAFLGLLGGSLFMSWFYVIKNRDNLSWIWDQYKLVIMGVGTLVGLTALMLIGGIFRAVRDSLSPRFEMWKLAVDLFRNHPAFGSGPYSAGSYLSGLFSVPPGLVHTHTHNILLNIVAELGLAGMLTAVWLILSILRQYYRAYLEEGNFISWGAAGALGSFLAHGLVDTLYVEPYYAFFLIAILGVSWPLITQRRDYWGRLCHIGLIGLLVLISGAGIRDAFWRIPLQRGVKMAELDLERSAKFLKLAQSRDSKSPLVAQQLGLIYGRQAAADPERASEYLALAMAEFEKAAAGDPDWAVNHANLSALYARSGHLQKALEQAIIAFELAPDSALITLNVAVIAELANKMDLAENAFRSYLELRAVSPSGPFWEATRLRQSLQQEFREKTNPDESWEKEIDALLEDIKSDPWNAQTRLRLAEIYLTRGNISQARHQVENAQLTIDPRAGLRVMNLWWIQAEIFIAEGNYSAGIDKAEAARDGWRNQSANGPGTYGSTEYGIKLYRSPVLEYDLVPQLENEPLTAVWIDRMIELGRWYTLIGDYNQAESTIQEVLLIDEDNTEAEQYLNYLTEGMK